MTRKRNRRVALVALLVLAIGTAAYAFTAANSVPNSQAGIGSGTISGYTVLNVELQPRGRRPGATSTPSSSTSTGLRAPSRPRLSARTRRTPTGTGGPTHFTCDFAVDPTVLSANQLTGHLRPVAPLTAGRFRSAPPGRRNRPSMETESVARIAAVVSLLALLGLGWWLLGPTQLGGRTAYAVVSGSSMQPQVELRATSCSSASAPRTSRATSSSTTTRTSAPNVLHRIVSAHDGDGSCSRATPNGFLDDVHPTIRPGRSASYGVVVPGLGSLRRMAPTAAQRSRPPASRGLRRAGGRTRGDSRRRRVRPRPTCACDRHSRAGTARRRSRRRTLRRAALAALCALRPRRPRRVDPARRHARPSSPARYAHTGYVLVRRSRCRPAPSIRTGASTTGETAFVRLVSSLDIMFSYRLASSRDRASSRGTTRIDASISDGSGWIAHGPGCPCPGLPRAEGGRRAACSTSSYLERLVAQMRGAHRLGHVDVHGHARAHRPDRRSTPSRPRSIRRSSPAARSSSSTPRALRLSNPDDADPVLEPREEGWRGD